MIFCNAANYIGMLLQSGLSACEGMRKLTEIKYCDETTNIKRVITYCNALTEFIQFFCTCHVVYRICSYVNMWSFCMIHKAKSKPDSWSKTWYETNNQFVQWYGSYIKFQSIFKQLKQDFPILSLCSHHQTETLIWIYNRWCPFDLSAYSPEGSNPWIKQGVKISAMNPLGALEVVHRIWNKHL